MSKKKIVFWIIFKDSRYDPNSWGNRERYRSEMFYDTEEEYDPEAKHIVRYHPASEFNADGIFAFPDSATGGQTVFAYRRGDQGIRKYSGRFSDRFWPDSDNEKDGQIISCVYPSIPLDADVFSDVEEYRRLQNGIEKKLQELITADEEAERTAPPIVLAGHSGVDKALNDYRRGIISRAEFESKAWNVSCYICGVRISPSELISGWSGAASGKVEYQPEAGFVHFYCWGYAHGYR